MCQPCEKYEKDLADKKMVKRVSLEIHGFVQGVGFRYHSRKQAQNLDLTGFVHNVENGTVELIAEGEEADLKKFIDWCYNGLGGAEVSKINVSWSKVTGEFSNFEIR